MSRQKFVRALDYDTPIVQFAVKIMCMSLRNKTKAKSNVNKVEFCAAHPRSIQPHKPLCKPNWIYVHMYLSTSAKATFSKQKKTYGAHEHTLKHLSLKCYVTHANPHNIQNHKQSKFVRQSLRRHKLQL